jgi:L-threonylcarbamoyladenylate synthase
VGDVAVTVPEGAAALLGAGALALLPTDTVYGIAAAAGHREACARLYALKRRPASQPTAIMLGSVDALLAEALPQTDERAAALCRSLLPGPLTLIVANPGHRFPHLCGDQPDRIGVRVAELEAEVAGLADAAGGLLITSANLRGGADPAELDQVPAELRAAAAFAVDGGRLPGRASAVIDISGPAPRVLREGPGMKAALRAIA